jgi:hypothetical protein
LNTVLVNMKNKEKVVALREDWSPFSNIVRWQALSFLPHDSNHSIIYAHVMRNIISKLTWVWFWQLKNFKEFMLILPFQQHYCRHA